MASSHLHLNFTKLVGMLELLEKTALEKDVDNYVGSVSSSSKLLCTICDDFLDLKKISTGTLEFVETAFRVQSILDDIVAEERILSDLKGLFFKVVIEGDKKLPVVIGDSVRIQQILLNLFSSKVFALQLLISHSDSRKFCLSGGITFRISWAETEDKQKAALTFVVEDTGEISQQTHSNRVICRNWYRSR